ncbi:hypothetical protein [Psychrobacter aquaticus]|uniref:YcxB-like protein domain-containing protein n=1 Tax=Psychrobacter aquaticus CMS 56 TaxID=1354303 RepID=U4T5Y8_9GAMM|nr:hypothetical protein [Psychrobacter aquaticus]ERL56807.1 hypothetical protein M917_0437 [Psychrobacter aquaticus CMS 56]
MTVTPLRIDTAIQPASYLRLMLYVGLTGVMVVLAWFAALALWQSVLILTVSAAVTIYLTLSRPILLHFSQPPLSQRVDRQWQLLIRTSRGDELWQAQLINVYRYQWAMSFEFIIVEPYRRSLSVTVFRDQVSADQWRGLSILANVSGSKAG